MKKLVSILSLVAVMALGTNAWAALSGTLYSNGSTDIVNNITYGASDTSGGAVAINAIVGQLAWTVDQLANGMWSYKYVYTPVTANKNQGIGAISIEFGQQPTDLTWSYSYAGKYTNMTNATTSGAIQTIDRTLAGSTAPYTYNSWLPDGTYVNVSTTFDGIQWFISEPANGSISMTLELTTSLAPMWGDIYMDGYNMTTNNGYAFFRNTNYDIDATQAFSLTGPILAGYLPTPGVAPVPIPPAVFLFGSGLSGLFFMRRRNVA